MEPALSEKLEHLGLPKREGWPQRYKVSSWQGRRSLFCQKELGQSHSPKSRNREMEESQSGQESSFGEKVVGQSECMK